MRVFITGASGFIGTAVAKELIDHNHEVVGLARSDESEAKLRDMGAEVIRGTLADLDVIEAASRDADGVIHLAFIHNFDDFAASAKADDDAINAIGRALTDSDKPLLVASGLAGAKPGSIMTEDDVPAPGPRKSEHTALEYVDRGVRAVAIRFAPSVHGDTDKHGFIPTLIKIARDKSMSGYPGNGDNRWAAVHVLDAARLVRLALESAPGGMHVHAVGDVGISSREIAEAIGKGLDVPVKSIPTDEVDAHFGWMGRFFSADMPASAAKTGKLFHWAPEHPGLIADLEAGFYFE